LKIAIIGPTESGKVSSHLKAAFRKKNIPFTQLIPSQNGITYSKANQQAFIWPKSQDEIPDLGLVRGIGSQIPSQIFYRLDWLWCIEREGVDLINSRSCLEIATNKMLTTQILTRKNLPNPDTIICESAELAIRAFDEFGGDVVIKPLYGARGRGVFRIVDRNHAEAIFRELEQIASIFYIQKFLPHNNEDFRLLILDGSVIASMKRKSRNWKTNIARGGTPEWYIAPEYMQELAIKAHEAVEGEFTGVDIMITPEGPTIVEVNAVPGYLGLQQVCPFNISEKLVDYLVERGKK
jgi:RimK family alpha-L-glutamate ligase